MNGKYSKDTFFIDPETRPAQRKVSFIFSHQLNSAVLTSEIRNFIVTVHLCFLIIHRPADTMNTWYHQTVSARMVI